MKISVVIPAYNASQYIDRAITSVLNQTRPADEVVVVDDGSQDDTAAIVRNYKNQVVLIEQANKGVSIARNVGVEAAAGDWIAFLDADDEWLPEKLKLQCEHLEHNPNLSWTTGIYDYCNCEQGHKQEPRLSCDQMEKVHAALAGKEYFESYFQAFALQANGHLNAMLFQKQTLLEAGLFLAGQQIGEDDDLCLRLAYLGVPMGFLPESVLIYHLGISTRATKKHPQSCHVEFLLDRHLKLSEQVGMLDEFKQCAAGKLAFWIRKLLITGNGSDVRRLIKRYGNLLNTSYRLSTYWGSWCPAAWNYKEKLKRKWRKASKE